VASTVKLANLAIIPGAGTSTFLIDKTAVYPPSAKQLEPIDARLGSSGCLAPDSRSAASAVARSADDAEREAGALVHGFHVECFEPDPVRVEVLE
jgi:hypothetical protein